MTELTIYAKANNPDEIFGWEPEQADFNEVLIGQKAKMTIELTNKDSNEVKLDIVGGPTSEFIKKYKIKKDKLKPGQSTDIEIELNDSIAPDVIKTALTLQADDREDTRITIPITGKVVEHLTPKAENVKKDAKANPTAQLKASNISGTPRVKAAAPKKDDTPKTESKKIEVEPAAPHVQPYGD